MGVCAGRQGIRPFFVSPDTLKQQFLCPYGNQLLNVCITRSCDTCALVCGDKRCKACAKLHLTCEKRKVKDFQALMEKRRDEHRQFVGKIWNMEEVMFEAMRARVKGYLETAVSEIIDKKYLQIVEGVYYRKGYVAVKGSEAEDFYGCLNSVDTKFEAAKDNLLSNFAKELERLACQLKALERKSIAQYVKGRGLSLDQSTAQSQKTTSTTRQLRALQLDSKILTRNKYSHLQYIQQCLDYPTKLQLIFRASQNAFKASRFHLRCDGIPHTLTLIRTEFGKTIAGYTPLPWNSSKGFSSDQSGKSFLLLLDLKQKMNLICKDKAIQCLASYGPVFGGGSDVAIADECNVGSRSCTYFPHSYNFEGMYRCDQITWTAISGVPHGKHFNVVDYEVFRVEW